MTTLAAPITYTLAETERLSEQTGKLYEFVNGFLVEKAMSTRANVTALKVAMKLSAVYPETRAHVFVEQPTYCFADPKEWRRPDVALVWADRLPDGVGDDELRTTPDLVVEIASPSNSYKDLSDRMHDFLNAGVPLVWVVDPPHRWVHAYGQDGAVAWFRGSDLLRHEALLPGFSVPVSEIFPIAAPVIP